MDGVLRQECVEGGVPGVWVAFVDEDQAARHGLRCPKCRQQSRTVIYVSRDGELKAALEGCRECCSGIYATRVED